MEKNKYVGGVETQEYRSIIRVIRLYRSPIVYLDLFRRHSSLFSRFNNAGASA